MQSLGLSVFSVVYCKGHESKTFRKKSFQPSFFTLHKLDAFCLVFFYLKILFLRTELKGMIICFKRNENIFNHRQ